MNTVIEEYMGKVYTIVILAVTSACMCAGITFGVLKLLGFYPTVSWVTLGLFIAGCVLWLLIGLVFIKKAYVLDETGKHKILRRDMMVKGKIFITIVLLLQFNFISYLIPSREFWAYAFFFVMLAAFFLDMKMVSITAAGITLSLIISSFVNADTSLPLMNEAFIAELLLRIICVSLSMCSILLLTFLISHFLINVKKEELEKNNARVARIISKASDMADGLMKASTSLSEISQNEGASAQELAATSESLLSNSNELITQTQESMQNLNELKECSSQMTQKMEHMESASIDLLRKTEENEQLLTSLKTLNEQVIQSTHDTNRVAEKLSEAVKEIDVTLNVIQEISESTNLLALNASIEAARAGDAGKGFAVVAQEVGKLANNTNDSLGEVQKVISKIQDNVRDMTTYIEENSHKLASQNEVFLSTFSSMKEMIVLLKRSMEDTAAMGEVHTKQEAVIGRTVSINEAIAESIQKENNEFTNISSMVESNASEVMQMTEQIDLINKMIEEMDELLNS